MEVSRVGGSIGSVRRAWCCLRVVSRAVVGCETGSDCKSVWYRKLKIDRTVPWSSVWGVILGVCSDSERVIWDTLLERSVGAEAPPIRLFSKPTSRSLYSQGVVYVV
jgi:hypothetical protein